eukprot:scaffold1193_cov158-Amphora_coffeaeformis.AAC.6
MKAQNRFLAIMIMKEDCGNPNQTTELRPNFSIGVFYGWSKSVNPNGTPKQVEKMRPYPSFYKHLTVLIPQIESGSARVVAERANPFHYCDFGSFGEPESPHDYSTSLS